MGDRGPRVRRPPTGAAMPAAMILLGGYPWARGHPKQRDAALAEGPSCVMAKRVGGCEAAHRCSPLRSLAVGERTEQGGPVAGLGGVPGFVGRRQADPTGAVAFPSLDRRKGLLCLGRDICNVSMACPHRRASKQAGMLRGSRTPRRLSEPLVGLACGYDSVVDAVGVASPPVALLESRCGLGIVGGRRRTWYGDKERGWDCRNVQWVVT